MRRRRRDLALLAGIVLGSAVLGVSRPRAETEEGLWQALRAGTAVAIMRHASAPGTGDPAGFRLGDCATQRNLPEEGRQQAQRIGEQFRAHGIDRARVFSSQWCRCRDTAEALLLGPVAELPELNSFFGSRADRGPQTAALKAWLATVPKDQRLVLVTHQVNISALTGEMTGSGDIVVARVGESGTLTVLGGL